MFPTTQIIAPHIIQNTQIIESSYINDTSLMVEEISSTSATKILESSNNSPITFIVENPTILTTQNIELSYSIQATNSSD